MAKILWFTGLSGSGKTTIALRLKEELEKQNFKIKVLDGDDVRNTLHKHLGFSPKDIKENNRLIVELCKENFRDFDFIIVPIISPFRESRMKARETFKDNFVEIFINCSIEECIRRDVKGHYKKAIAGEIKNFIGIAKEVPFEKPENPEVIICTERDSIEEGVQRIKKLIL